ncbi:uncharacterized protein L969DRAFT_96312 [Mixia osmundae IAM 14324]|uniref:60S ribosomal protein L35a n=1 Tax=Mixia osmundae (strain CBS 9802 / IAM 14324 / JCM 22182 / KY 12970) TaxID=764103 RepID=G7E526_MIXOS|nr:uncharacterized protein L969DRAFT_96312 [Mixia osmundae IAM 14324]KEI37798.1 hypothetical protein L969DRAFT_96312 [Mixia osmundae IAM 14324]GAA97936.1 hypothetical protein E5Q_04616 [Mixia osmundae IAM 14324]
MAAGPRLYAKGRVQGFKRAKRNQRENTSLIQIEGVANNQEARWYCGKRVAYVYKAQKPSPNGSRVRVIWGKVTREHGNSGIVKAKFRKNLPPHTFGASVRVVRHALALHVACTCSHEHSADALPVDDMIYRLDDVLARSCQVHFYILLEPAPPAETMRGL